MGSLRFRRSMRLGPGLRLNLTKRGIGLSAGPRGARTSVHSTGSSTRSVGIPGTGLYYRDQRRAGSRTRAAGGRRAGTRTASGGPPPPHVHASVGELLTTLGPERRQPPARRALTRAAADRDLGALVALAEIPGIRGTAAAAALLLAAEQQRPGAAGELAATLSPRELVHDPEVVAFLDGLVPVPLLPGLAAPLPGVAAVGVAAAYVLNRSGRHEQAAALTAGVDPVDTATAALVIESGRAHNALGRFETAKDELAPILRRTSLGRTVRAVALEQRALAHLGLRSRARARQDVERAADLCPSLPSLEALRELVAA